MNTVIWMLTKSTYIEKSIFTDRVSSGIHYIITSLFPFTSVGESIEGISIEVGKGKE